MHSYSHALILLSPGDSRDLALLPSRFRILAWLVHLPDPNRSGCWISAAFDSLASFGTEEVVGKQLDALQPPASQPAGIVSRLSDL